MQRQSLGPNLHVAMIQKPAKAAGSMTALKTISGADHIEALLDEALEETFPASDPIALTIDAATYCLA